MDYDQLIKNWHKKAAKEKCFSNFVFEYLAFVAYLKRKKFPEAQKDREAIQRLKQDVMTKDVYLKEIDDNKGLKDAWQKIKDELDSSRLGNVSGNTLEAEEIKWWNCTAFCLEQNTQKEKDKIKGVIYNLSDWENMVEFWYSIRNNLFHGAKNPQDERDQLLVDNGFKTLQSLVGIFLVGERRR